MHSLSVTHHVTYTNRMHDIYSVHIITVLLLHVSVPHSPSAARTLCPLLKTTCCYAAIFYGRYSLTVFPGPPNAPRSTKCSPEHQVLPGPPNAPRSTKCSPEHQVLRKEIGKKNKTNVTRYENCEFVRPSTV